MKQTLLTLSLLTLAVMPGMAATVNFPDVPQAKQKAKDKGKPALILWYGSDWLHDAGILCRDWSALAKSDLPVVFGQFDEKTGLDGEIRKKILPLERYNLPTSVLLAPDGTFMATFGPTVTRDTELLKKSVSKLVSKAPKFMSLAAKARASKGVEAAKAAGQALAMLRPTDAMLNQELRKIINKEDPNDESGYRAVYGMDHLDMYAAMNLVLKGGPDGKLEGAKRDFAAAEKFVRKALANKALKGERRQQWLAGLYYVQRLQMEHSEKKDRSAMLATLKEIVAINPDSECGKGAAKFYHYWDPKSVTEINSNFYIRGNQTLRFEKDWHVNVSSSIKGPGVYVFSLKPMENGSMVTRNYRLAVNGKVVSTANIKPDVNTKSVELTVPAGISPNAKVEVWLTAQSNDHWLECSGFIEMKKK